MLEGTLLGLFVFVGCPEQRSDVELLPGDEWGARDWDREASYPRMYRPSSSMKLPTTGLGDGEAIGTGDGDGLAAGLGMVRGVGPLVRSHDSN